MEKEYYCDVLVCGGGVSEFAAVRVMPPCIAMGQAAGICAAIAAKNGMTAGEVPHEEVQRILVENGAYIG